MKHFFASGIYLFRPAFLFTGLIIIALGLVQCKSKMMISSKEDFYLLDDIERFEYEYSLHEGIKYKLLGDYSRAVFFLERCVDLFPYSDVSYFELSKIYFLVNETEEAENYALKAVKMAPDNKWYHHHLARIYIETEEFDQAINVYEDAIRLFEDDTELYFSLASLYSSQSSFDEAIRIYDLLETMIGIDERISLPREQIYMEKGEFEKAHSEIQKLIARFPLEARYYGVLAELYTAMQMYKEALESYKILFRIEPENGTAQLSVADFYLQQGNFDDAWIYLVTAFRNPSLEYPEKIHVLSTLTMDRYITDNHLDKIEQLGVLLMEDYPDQNLAKAVMSDLYVYKGSYEIAGKLLNELHLSEPDNSYYAEQYIAALSFNEEYDKVLEVGEKLIDKFPGSVLIHYFLGAVYHFKEMTEVAIETFEKALKLNGITREIEVQIYSYLGDLLNTIKDFEGSDENFEKVLKIDSSNVFVLNNYAYYLAVRGDKLEKALEMSEKSIKEQPENTSFLDTYSWILYKKGDYQNALKYIELAYSKGGSGSYEITKHYGMILLELKRYDEAFDFLEKARDLAEDKEEVDEILSSFKEKISID
ncbi:MAG: tetratricopeptide repeat protein [Ignavibacteriaceae bacterium]